LPPRLVFLVALTAAVALSAYNLDGTAQLAMAQYSEETAGESYAPTTYVTEEGCASVEVEEGYYLYYSPTEPNYFCVYPATQFRGPSSGAAPRYLLPALMHPTRDSIAVLLKGNLLPPPYRSFTLRVGCPHCNAYFC
jgi:hypothetical protein